MNSELNLILKSIKCNFICLYDEKRQMFSSKEDFEKSGM